MTSELLHTYQFLASGLRLDPCLCLANAVAWLDPLWGEEVEYDEGDALYFGLHVVRRAFPDIYADAVEAMRQGATATQLDQIVCGGISAYGIPLENVEWLGWGIPLPGYGARLEDPDFYEQHPDVVPVLALFGIHPQADERLVDVPAEAFTVAKVIADSLEAQSDERWKQVGWLLRWLFSCSGNSSVDYDDEALSEFQPLAWDQEDIAIAIDIIEEADGIMQDVNAGLAVLGAQSMVQRALHANIRRVDRAMRSRAAKHNNPHFRLTWVPLRQVSGISRSKQDLIVVEVQRIKLYFNIVFDVK